MQKLSAVRFANSVLCGGAQKVFFEAPEYELLLDDYTITVTNRKTGKSVDSTIFNTIYMHREADEKPKRMRTATKSPQAFRDPEMFEAP
jgi:hypothetical protein